MIETARVDRWLYERLAGDATLSGLVGGRIYAFVAPQGTAFPFVVFAHQGGHDVLGVGPARVMVSLLYQVKAVGQTAAVADLQPVADRIDALLHGASGAVPDGTILACVREQAIEEAEVDDGVQYRHVGGLYRLIAQ